MKTKECNYINYRINEILADMTGIEKDLDTIVTNRRISKIRVQLEALQLCLKALDEK